LINADESLVSGGRETDAVIDLSVSRTKIKANLLKMTKKIVYEVLPAVVKQSLKNLD
jgi:hypothetical protein